MADEKTLTQADIDKAVKDAVTAAEEALKGKNNELLDEVKKLKADLRKVKEVSPEDVAAIEGERDKAVADLTAAQKELKTAITERDKAAEALETESGFTQKLLIQDGLKSALISNGVKDEDFIDSLSAKFGAGATIKVDGETRVAMYGDKPLGDFIKEWTGSDAGKKFVEAPANGGGGSNGSRGNPGGKTMTRSAFDALGQDQRASFAKEGGKVVDA